MKAGNACVRNWIRLTDLIRVGGSLIEHTQNGRNLANSFPSRRSEWNFFSAEFESSGNHSPAGPRINSSGWTTGRSRPGRFINHKWQIVAVWFRASNEGFRWFNLKVHYSDTLHFVRAFLPYYYCCANYSRDSCLFYGVRSFIDSLLARREFHPAPCCLITNYRREQHKLTRF